MSERADQLVEAGLWLKLSGDLDGARDLLLQALKLHPAHPQAQQLLQSLPSTEAPPGGAAPPSNVPPPSEGALLESDWALATGMIEDKQRMTSLATPLPVPDPPRDEPALPQPKQAEDAWAQALEVRFDPPSEADPESGWDSSVGLPAVPVAPRADLGKGMDLVANPVPAFTPPPGTLTLRTLQDEVHTLLEGARELLALDDHTGAIDLIYKAQELAPADPEVTQMREKSELVLQSMFESKLGSMDKRPRVLLKDDEIIWLNLDHRAGFVLAQIDGTVTFEDLFAVSGMTRLDTVRILAQLMEQGVIAS